MTRHSNLLAVDWSQIPVPEDDGAALGLEGRAVPSLALVATGSSAVTLAGLSGRTVVYAYPMTGKPGVPLPDGWDGIPGARGCTPQSCAFRDHFAEMKCAGVDHLFGLSTQTTDDQQEAAERLHLPFPLLSDHKLKFALALGLPTMVVGVTTLLKRLAMVIDDGMISRVFYPVFPPDRNAADVLAWLRENPR